MRHVVGMEAAYCLCS